MTIGKTKSFSTPFGMFSYKHLSPKKYSIGTTLWQIDQYTSCIMATKEKALCDLIALETQKFTSTELKEYLLDNLRIEKEDLITFNQQDILEIGKKYRNSNIILFDELLRGF